MTVEVPKAAEDQTVSELFSAIRQRPWEELSHIYLVDCQNRLIGQVPIESLLTAEGGTKLSALRGAPPVEVQPDDNAETVALRAVERHDADVAVVVALILAITAVVATLVASVLPLGLARLGSDPAMASGPVATVLQDILSVAIYLSIATMVLHW